MDKRQIAFFAIIAAAFVVVNLFFSHQEQERLAEWKEKQKVFLAKKQASLESDLIAKSIPLSEMPIVPVFEDEGHKKFFAMAVVQQGTLLVLTDKPYLKKVFADGAYELFAEKKAALYKKGPDAKFSTGQDLGKDPRELQIITLSNPPTVEPGDYSKGKISTLTEQLALLGTKESALDRGQENKVALQREGGEFLPVAIYEASSQTWVPLSLLTEFQTGGVQEKISLAPAEIKYYVLENEFVQLVISSQGGAVAEINLPFETEKNEESVVKPIEFDRLMVEQHPENARFPARGYWTADGIYHNEGVLGGYLPLLRRNLYDGKQVFTIPPKYYALNLVSEYPELSLLNFSVKSFEKDKLVLEASQGYRRIRKTYSLKSEKGTVPYTFDFEIAVMGDGRGLWLTTGVPEVEMVSGRSSPELKVRTVRGNKSEVESLSLPKDNFITTSSYPDWVANTNGFFGVILDPLTEIAPGYRSEFVSGETVPSRLVDIDQKYQRFVAKDLPGYTIQLPLKTTGGSMKFRVFAGPFSERVLTAVDQTFTDPLTKMTPDYTACRSFHAWYTFIAGPFAALMLMVMTFLHAITNSWGLSIILLTVVLRLILYPLNAWSTRSVLKSQEIQPFEHAIRERYKKDPQKMQLEILNLYKEKGYNPLSLFVPFIIQIPFLLGMFDLLKTNFELRGASFIPGWIDDLAAPDVLFSWSYPLFFIGTEFHLLPVLLGAAMYFQQWLMQPSIKDESKMTEQQKQMKSMNMMMPAMMLLIFYSFPSGLNIYWLSSSLLGVAQQWFMQKQNQKKKESKLETSPKKFR